MKEKISKHLCLIDAMSRNTFALHYYSFMYLNTELKRQLVCVRT
jgi:hypothetical protein